MNRDDVLRELGLLPAWKLRAPVEAKQVQQVAVETLETAQVVVVAIEESAPEKPAIEKSSSVTEIQYEITMSEDKHWAFVCELGIPADRMDIDSQDTLFK